MKVTKYFLSTAVALTSASNLFSDQVFSDDVIVQFSLAVGNDAVNGESFGFDTIRLKENNLRIGFVDTSNSASFPSNDWELTANDSNNGGGNYFAIRDVTGNKVPFTVEAGARTNALFVEDSGRVGLGTNNPAVELHVTDGDSPTLRLEQNGTSGFTPQTWDVAGNETNFFVRDVTSGSKLPFRILKGAADKAMTIAANGNVGLGTTSPSHLLHLSNAGPVRIAMTNSTITDDAINDNDWIISANGRFSINSGGDASSEMGIDASGNVTIKGTLTANGSTFPDYVFEEGYNLLSLEEVESYIQHNGHLPGIPTAQQVDQFGGHNMTELQLSLLEKVEELTLYTIQQHRMNLEQNEVIQKQANAISELQEKVNLLMSQLE